MKINGEPTRTIRLHPDDDRIVQVIDQRQLPHHLDGDLTSVLIRLPTPSKTWSCGARP
jgi:hypothetical protein